MTTFFKGCFLICFLFKIGFSAEQKLSQFLQKKHVSGVRIWTQVHRYKEFKEYHIYSINHKKFLSDTLVIEDTIFNIYGKKIAKYFINNIIIDTTSMPIVIEKCGDLEERDIAFEFFFDDGKVANLLLDLKSSLSNLTIYASKMEIENKKIINKEVVLPYVKEIVDTTCYGFKSCSGYCFKFYEPHFIRTARIQKEKLEKLKIENQKRDSIDMHRSILNELQLIINHINNFDQNVLKQIVEGKYQNSCSKNEHLVKQVEKLKMKAQKNGLNLLWCNKERKIYLEWYNYPGINAEKIIDSLQIEIIKK